MYASDLEASERIVSSIRAQMAGDLSSAELRLNDPWNGVSLSYSVAPSVFLVMELLSWAFFSVLLTAAVLVLKRRGLRKRKELWRREAERLGLVQ